MDSPLHTVAHFAINADDLGASRRFYEQTFQWTFEPWGPPEFFHIFTAGGERPGPLGALQRRRDLEPDLRVTGFECTVAVPDADGAARAASASGGRILMERTTITGVGHLVWLADPSGNVVGAMQYDAGAD